MAVFVQIKNGKIVDTTKIAAAFRALKDGYYMVDINWSKKRSSLQNAYLWGCCYPLALKGFRDIGYDEVTDTEDVHDIFKSLFLKKHIENKDGLVIEFSGSTKKLSTIEFNTYIEQIAKFCAENLYIVIPEPGQQAALW